MSRGAFGIIRFIIRAIFFAFLLYLFLTSISLLGASFKLLGKGVAEGLISTTANPFSGLLIGILTTAVVQSSSLTTSLVVALVSAGALTVPNAVPIIMGANIGTTITCAIVSLGHIRRNDEFERAYAGAMLHDVFNILSVAIILPIQMATGFLDKISYELSSIFYGSQATTFDSPVNAIVKPFVKSIEHFFMDLLQVSEKATGVLCVIVALILIFTALTFMVKFMKQITASRLEHWIHRVFNANIYLVMIIGIVMTSIIQSSSITTSMLVPMLGAGLVSLEQAFPITVGANIGTTVTALLATLAGNQAGLTIAFVHLVFNICGTLIWFIPSFMRKIPLNIARFMAFHFVRKKKLIILYIAGVFFILPLIGMFISKLW
ncbi:MAG: Na/Pi symporter [Pseudomonadota bacterium]